MLDDLKVTVHRDYAYMTLFVFFVQWGQMLSRLCLPLDSRREWTLQELDAYTQVLWRR